MIDRGLIALAFEDIEDSAERSFSSMDFDGNLMDTRPVLVSNAAENVDLGALGVDLQ